MKSNYRRLGNYIQQVSVKNKDLKVEKLLGVSITKKFIRSIANTIGTDMSTYKIVRTGQFAYGPVTSRNGDRISVALLQESDCIVSTSYTVFEIIDTEELLTEYLMMWFRREEFDRYARYMSHGSVREIFGWEEMCDIELPVPSIEEQREIVKEYHTIVSRIKLNDQLNQKLEETAQAIYKQWFVDFEFPDENGQPYKSSGGEMEYNAELDQEIPKGWDIVAISEYCADMKNGATPNRGVAEYWNSNDIPWLKTGEIHNSILTSSEEFISSDGHRASSTKILPVDTVLMAMYGATAGQVGFLKFEATTNQACCANGGAQANLSKTIIEALRIIKPSDKLFAISPFKEIINYRERVTREIIQLENISELLLQRVATISDVINEVY
jgi:type I restriction enzyme, S subunit